MTHRAARSNSEPARTYERGESAADWLMGMIVFAVLALAIFGARSLWEHSHASGTSKAAECRQTCEAVNASWQWSESAGCVCGSK